MFEKCSIQHTRPLSVAGNIRYTSLSNYLNVINTHSYNLHYLCYTYFLHNSRDIVFRIVDPSIYQYTLKVNQILFPFITGKLIVI